MAKRAGAGRRIELLQAQARMAIQFDAGRRRASASSATCCAWTASMPPARRPQRPHRPIRTAAVSTPARATSCSRGRSAPSSASPRRSGCGSSTARNLAKPTWAEAIRRARGERPRDAAAPARYAVRRDPALRPARGRAADAAVSARAGHRLHRARAPSARRRDAPAAHAVRARHGATSTQVGYTNFTRGAVGGHECTGEVAVWLSPRLRLSFDVSDIDQRAAQHRPRLRTCPARDRRYGMTALWRHAIGETRVQRLPPRSAARRSTGVPAHARPTARARASAAASGSPTTSARSKPRRSPSAACATAPSSSCEYTFEQARVRARRALRQPLLHAGRAHLHRQRLQSLTWEAGPSLPHRVSGLARERSPARSTTSTSSGAGDAGTAVLTPDGSDSDRGLLPAGELLDLRPLHRLRHVLPEQLHACDSAVRRRRHFAQHRDRQRAMARYVGASGSVVGADRLTAVCFDRAGWQRDQRACRAKSVCGTCTCSIDF